MALSPGEKLGPYECIALLGKGGMGEVYRARDPKLNREVAIKVLPAAVAQDQERLARFEREARILASLNHPNIAQIYGLEHIGDVRALVMELVPGATLSVPQPLDAALNCARQIAEALETTHELGITHRDLKPANIMVKADGVVKVLDFGLASSPNRDAAGDPGNSPTLSMAATQAGTIMGTAAYMSPEQAAGKVVDKRSDIWSFGVVLYEMLTGATLFDGETISHTLAHVLTTPIDFAKLPPSTPAPVVDLLKRCLDRNLKTRLQAIGEARIAIERQLSNPAGPSPAPPSLRSRWTWLPWILAALSLIAAGLAWFRLTRDDDAGAIAMHFQIPLPPGTREVSFPRPQYVPSPDGRTLAFIALDASGGKPYLWIRPLGAASAQRLDGTEGADQPFWSPDSQSIGFFVESQVKRIAVSGGAVRIVCDISELEAGPARNMGFGFGWRGGTWNHEGVIVYGRELSGLMRVPAAGGTPAPASALEKGELGHGWPQFLPDGRHLLYLASAGDRSRNSLYVGEPRARERVLVMSGASRGVWAPPGYLLFMRDGTLFAQRMGAGNFQLEGEPLVVAQDVTAETHSVSQTGILAYRAGGQLGTPYQLTWYDRQGKRGGVVGKPLVRTSPVLSPDGKLAAIILFDRAHRAGDTWVVDVSTGMMTRMTRDDADVNVTWSPDSSRLAITRLKGSIALVNVSSGTATPLLAEGAYVEDWSPDGQSLLAVDDTQTRLSLIPLAPGAKPKTILETPYRKYFFRFSPDGKSVAYESQESGGKEIYVASFPSFAVKRQLSSGGAYYPAWGSQGKEVLFRSSDGSMMSAVLRNGTTLETGLPKPLFKFGPGTLTARFDATRDGSRFLVCDLVPERQLQELEIALLVNWLAATR